MDISPTGTPESKGKDQLVKLDQEDEEEQQRQEHEDVHAAPSLTRCGHTEGKLERQGRKNGSPSPSRNPPPADPEETAG